MLPLSSRSQVWIGIVLGALLIVTRDYHFATFRLLPSASYAVFFLAGVYLPPLWVFPVLWVLAALLDLWAVTIGGVSAFCISPAYVFLIPAYGALWLAGRRFASAHGWNWSRFLYLGACLLIGTVVCELLASGSFYFFSGRFSQPTLEGFGPSFVAYFPSSLGSVLFYTGLAGVVHAVAVLAARAGQKRDASEIEPWRK